MNFEVIKKSVNCRNGIGNDSKLNNLGPIALFTIFMLTTSCGKHLEDISFGHIVPLMYKQIGSVKDSDYLSIGFDRSRQKRPDELASNKIIKGKYHLRIVLKVVLGFVEYEQKAT